MMIVLPIFETQNGDNLVDNPMTIIPLHIVSYHSPTVMAQIGGTTIAIVHTHTHTIKHNCGVIARRLAFMPHHNHWLVVLRPFSFL